MASRFQLLLRIALPAFTLAGLSSCNEEPQIPTYLVISSSGNPLVAGQSSSVTLEAQVLDGDRKGIAGVHVFFSVVEGTATLDGVSATTDNTGTARMNAEVGTAAGSILIEATVPGIADPATFSFTLAAGPPTIIKIISGDQQEAGKNTVLADRLEVLVTDAFDNPVGYLPLTYLVTSGNGLLTETVSVTGANGQASTKFTLGDSEPVNKIKVSFQQEKSVEFTVYSLLPVNLQPLARSDNSITLEWSPNVNPNLASYMILRSIGNLGQFVAVGEIMNATTTTFADTHIKQGELYTYKISIITTKGNGVESNTQSGEATGFFNLSGWVQDVTMSSDGTKIYIVDDITQKIQFLSTASLKVVDSIQTDYNCFHAAVSNDHTRLYVTDRWNGKLYVYGLPGKALITTVDLTAACGTAMIADVYRTSDGQLFVSSNESFVAKVDEANGYAATRVTGNLSYSGRPSFVGDYGGFLYMEESLMSPNSLYKFDLSLPDVPKVLEDQHGKVNGTSGAILDPSLNRVYTTFGQVLSTIDFSTDGALNDSYTAIQIAPASNRIYATFDKDFPPDKFKLLSFDRTTFAAGPVVQLGYAANRILISPDETTAFLVTGNRIYRLTLPE